MAMFNDLIGRDTLIILVVGVLAWIHPELAELAIGGLLGYLGLKKKGE